MSLKENAASAALGAAGPTRSAVSAGFVGSGSGGGADHNRDNLSEEMRPAEGAEVMIKPSTLLAPFASPRGEYSLLKNAGKGRVESKAMEWLPVEVMYVPSSESIEMNNHCK